MTADEDADPGITLVPGAVNFRDVGGLAAGPFRTRSGVLYRSGNLARLEDPGVAALRALRVSRIVDLRGDDEVDRAPNVLADMRVDVRRVPILHETVTAYYERDAGLDDLYRSMVDDSAPRVVAAVRAVVHDGPVLVHCTIGKDRTGVVVALALAAAGVDEDAVVADYARTHGLLPVERSRQIVAMLQARHPRASRLPELVTMSPATVMRGLLDDLTRRYGSPTEYLRAYGLADPDIAGLRDSLIASGRG